MTATLGDVTPRKRKPEPSAEELAAAELVRLAKKQGLSLTGPDGLLKHRSCAAGGTRPAGPRPPATSSSRTRHSHNQSACIKAVGLGTVSSGCRARRSAICS